MLSELGEPVLAAAQSASIDGMHLAVLAGAVAVAIAAAAVTFLLRKPAAATVSGACDTPTVVALLNEPTAV